MSEPRYIQPYPLDVLDPRALSSSPESYFPSPSEGDDSDSMPPLEEIPAARTDGAGSAAKPAAKPASDDDDDDDDDDEESDIDIIEVVDLPDETSAHTDVATAAGASSPSPARRRTRRRGRQPPPAAAASASAASASAASAAAASAASASASAAGAASGATSGAASASASAPAPASPSPSPARKKPPSGGLKTTGLDSEDGATPTKKAAAGRKRSAQDDGDAKDAAAAATDETKKEAADQHCSICLDVPSREDVTKLNKCEHVFCFGCIETWADRENTCPLCKVRFTRIERVHKPPPSKRRKKGGGGGSAKGKGGKGGNVSKATKRIKTRDQREDLVSANPLAGLFEHLEASGTMPRSIAQLIFSGLSIPDGFARGPGPEIFYGSPFSGFGSGPNSRSGSRRRPGASRRTAASASSPSVSYTVARDPATGRFARVPRASTRASSAASSSAPPAAASAAGASTRRSTRQSSSLSGEPSSSAAAAASSRSRRPSSGGDAPRVSVTLNSYGPTSVNLPPGSPPSWPGPTFGPPTHDFSGFFGPDSDDEDDDYEPFLPPDAGGFGTFVRRARENGRGRHRFDEDTRGFSPPRMPPTQERFAPADTADTAIEIGDSDDDDDGEVVVVD